MTKLCVPLALAALWVCPGVQAQGVRERVGERIQDLNLTDGQEAKIGDIRNDFRPKVKAAVETLATVVKDEVEKVRAVLTAEQKTTLAALKEERREHRAEGLAERFAHLEELDVTDAEMAKIAEIRKEFRPKVVQAMESLKGILTADQKEAREDALKSGKKRTQVLASLKLTGDQKEKVEAVGNAVVTLVREELERMRDVLSEGQKEKLQEFKVERRDRVRDRMAHRIASLKELNLTDAQKNQIAEIRKEYRPRVQEAGNVLRTTIREEVQEILAVIKG